jgi:Rrf2 family protein
MQLTRAADYAIRVMIHLAGLPAGARVSRTDLAAAAECPEQFLSKVLQNLARAGLVVSHRGNTGGFELDEDRRGASLLDVVEAIEGPIRLNQCMSSDRGCNRQTQCPAHPVWADAQLAMVTVLRGSRIEDLAERSRELRRADLILVNESV